ncbi:MAG: glycosyltransferase [Saprospiraceae bacterium]|nr:glycosyltransferase [Saprospiraceae bacterium]
MSYKVLHIVDYYLQETMNWLEELLIQTESDVEHSIAAIFNSGNHTRFKIIPGFGMQSTYPPSFTKKIVARLKQSTFESNVVDYINKNNIDVVHFHFGHIAIRFKNIIAKIKCKKFVSLYGFDYEYLVHNNPSTLKDYRYLSSRDVHFIVEGNYSKALLDSYKIPSSQIHIVQMFFKRSVEINQVQLSYPIKILQVATYTEKKGQLQFLEALGHSGLGNFFIVEFYGEKMSELYFQQLEESVKKYNLQSIRFGSKITISEYLNKLRECHFIVNLSNKADSGDTEGGCPVFIKDAFSLAKPAITTNHCDIPEIAVHNYNSFISSENNIHHVIDNLSKIVQLNQRSYLAMCKAANETARPKCENDWTRHSLLKAYHD